MCYVPTSLSKNPPRSWLFQAENRYLDALIDIPGVAVLHRSDGEVLIVKLEDGEDVHMSLADACRCHGMNFAWVYGGIGILREFTLGYFTGRDYIKKYFEEPHELLSLSGSVTLDTEVPIHLHCSVSSRDFNVLGGHLFKGTANVLNEVFIKRLQGIELGRKLSPVTGYYELDMK
jgi:hypothetical protein